MFSKKRGWWTKSKKGVLKGKTKGKPGKRKQNRKKRRILKTGLLGTQKRKTTLKLQENSLLVFFPNKKHKEKIKNTKQQEKQIKNTFCVLANTHLFLVIFVFSSYTLLFLQSCVCWKHYKNSVFSRARLLGITDSKAPFEASSQDGTFATQSAMWGFPLCLLKPLFL